LETQEKRNKQNVGLTIIETLITLLVVSVIVAITIPGLHRSQQNFHIDLLQQDLFKDIKLSRNEAIIRAGSPVILCASSDGTRCNTQFWESGWIAFFDINGDQTFNINTGEKFIKQRLYSQNTISIRTTGFNHSSILTFDSQGLVGPAGTIVLCDSRGKEHALGIIVADKGLPVIAIDEEDSDDIVNTHEGLGSNVDCP